MASILLIHLGGLGDVCLSESTFLSLKRHFGRTMEAVGNKRVLDLFDRYFTRIRSIEERTWGYLFSDSIDGPKWQTIIFIGKDLSGSIRKRLRELTGRVIFIDMYPGDKAVHAEEYQLEQLALHGIAPSRIGFSPRNSGRVILYPENPYQKKKWPVGCFIEVYEELKARKVNALLMRPPDLDLRIITETYAFAKLSDIASFFSGGGLFVSNDSGLAHFAATCSLRTLTLFWDTDPAIWRPKGSRVIECGLDSPPAPPEIVSVIMSIISDKR
jgi:ADP-heptose:LPS heptosyltransferase